MTSPLNVLGRGKAWKAYVEQRLLTLADQVAELEAAGRIGPKRTTQLEQVAHEMRDLATKLRELDGRHVEASSAIDELNRMQSDLQDAVEDLLTHRRYHAISESRSFENAIIAPLLARIDGQQSVAFGYEVLLAARATELLVLILPPGEANRAGLRGLNRRDILDGVQADGFSSAFLVIADREGRRQSHRSDEILAAFKAMPAEALSWAQVKAPNRSEESVQPVRSTVTTVANEAYFSRLQQILANLDCIDFYAAGTAAEPDGPSRVVPFNRAEALPHFALAEPKRRSVVLLHNNYYHFNCLAEGLRKRGWDAVTVSLESPDSPQRQFYHGEDINLFDVDPDVMAKKTSEFFKRVPERFGNLHFYGQGYPTFFQANIENSPTPRATPWDFLELRRHRTIIGFMPSGCTDGGLQSSIRELTGGLCSRCVWELRPDVCSDARSLAWNRKLALLCDWVGLECDHATPERIGPKSVYGPVVTALDPARWHPDLDVPDDMRIDKRVGEILVYHAVGNYATRRAGDRDIKGTGAVLAAIEQLKAEGFPVRLIFAHDVPSTRVRFLQVQADIVVDQLNYGRYGANARESMMLGRPTICRLTPRQASPLPPLRPIQEVPMLDASEDTIIDVLRALVIDREQRLELGRKAREFALAWHGQDACAERYEKVIDRIRAGLSPECDELYPA